MSLYSGILSSYTRGAGAVARAQHRGGAGDGRARGAVGAAGGRGAVAVRALAAAGGRAADLRARLRAAARLAQAPRVSGVDRCTGGQGKPLLHIGFVSKDPNKIFITSNILIIYTFSPLLYMRNILYAYFTTPACFRKPKMLKPGQHCNKLTHIYLILIIDVA